MTDSSSDDGISCVSVLKTHSCPFDLQPKHGGQSATSHRIFVFLQLFYRCQSPVRSRNKLRSLHMLLHLYESTKGIFGQTYNLRVTRPNCCGLGLNGSERENCIITTKNVCGESRRRGSSVHIT